MGKKAEIINIEEIHKFLHENKYINVFTLDFGLDGPQTLTIKFNNGMICELNPMPSIIDVKEKVAYYVNYCRSKKIGRIIDET